MGCVGAHSTDGLQYRLDALVLWGVGRMAPSTVPSGVMRLLHSCLGAAVSVAVVGLGCQYWRCGATV